MNLDQALGTFLEEARELLAQMESLLLAAEDGAASQDDLHALFRCAHTIKGSAGFFGLDGVVRFTHGVESVLDRLRNGDIPFDASLAALLLECRDHIAGLVEVVTGGLSPPGSRGRNWPAACGPASASRRPGQAPTWPGMLPPRRLPKLPGCRLKSPVRRP